MKDRIRRRAAFLLPAVCAAMAFLVVGCARREQPAPEVAAQEQTREEVTGLKTNTPEIEFSEDFYENGQLIVIDGPMLTDDPLALPAGSDIRVERRADNQVLIRWTGQPDGPNTPKSINVFFPPRDGKKTYFTIKILPSAEVQFSPGMDGGDTGTGGSGEPETPDAANSRDADGTGGTGGEPTSVAGLSQLSEAMLNRMAGISKDPQKLEKLKNWLDENYPNMLKGKPVSPGIQNDFAYQGLVYYSAARVRQARGKDLSAQELETIRRYYERAQSAFGEFLNAGGAGADRIKAYQELCKSRLKDMAKPKR